MIATGVPKPEMPSSRAPKQKPITTRTMRRSFGRWLRTQARKASKRFEFDRDVIEQERIDDDPHHRPQREHDAVQNRARGQIDWQIPDPDRDDQADDEARERSLPGRPPEDAEQHENDENGQGRNDERKRQAPCDRRQQLAKHAPSQGLIRLVGACFPNRCAAIRGSESLARYLSDSNLYCSVIGGKILDVGRREVPDHDRHHFVLEPVDDAERTDEGLDGL